MTLNALEVEEVLWIREGEGIRTAGSVPKDAAFLKDHFPAFPVLPGVLALEMLKQSAERYLNQETEDADARYLLQSATNVKFVRYLKPGDHWEAELHLIANEGLVTTWKGRLFSNDNTAVTARLKLKKQ